MTVGDNNLFALLGSKIATQKVSCTVNKTAGFLSTIRNKNDFLTRTCRATRILLRVLPVHLLEWCSTECRKTKTKVMTLTNHYGHETIQRTNQNSKQIHVAGTKRGKTCASESRLVLVLLLIG